MKCPKCNSDIPDNSRNCPKCFTPIIKIKPMRVCTNCGSEVPDDADTCPGCGRTVKRKAHQTGSFNSETDRRNDTTGFSAASEARSSSGNKILNELKRDRYAWLQAVLPGTLALLYHLLILRNNISFNLVNTFIIYEALVFFFGYSDIRELNRRPEMMEGLVYSEKFVYMTYFLPTLSLWDRRLLPGMNRKALYPLIHTVIFTLLIISIMFTMDIRAISQANPI
ncbi:hypothetical protein UYO_0628 [Lachnospiraceae bacterium JC7]|nr:hypothetical protein UYO_0628 [Lachnospiraceae bacterium JC7]